MSDIDLFVKLRWNPAEYYYLKIESSMQCTQILAGEVHFYRKQLT